MRPYEETVHRIGVDIIEIARVNEALQRFGPRFLQRVYTEYEATLCQHKASRLAARFAAKEAVMKVLGTGVKGVGWREIEIQSKSTGEPLIILYGKAKVIADSLGLSEFAVSLSHSKDYAVATVIATTD